MVRYQSTFRQSINGWIVRPHNCDLPYSKHLPAPVQMIELHDPLEQIIYRRE